MKKKLIILAIIFTIFFIASIIICYILYCQKSLNIALLDCYENEITNYEDNKMPFTIKNEDKNQKIKVNGKNYSGERLYEPGKYKIEIKKGISYKKIIVNINNIKKNPENEYNIYLTSGTLQTLFANLDIANKKDLNGFLWLKRDSIIDIDTVKQNIPNLILSEYMGDLSEKEIRNQVLPEVKEYIKEVLKKDDNAYFHLYIDEYRFYLELEFFGKIGLADDRYDITIYSDGTLSYTTDFSNATITTRRKYEIRQKDSYEIFLEKKENYENILNTMRNGTLKYNDMPGSYFVKKGEEDYDYDFLLISTLRKNIRYLLQYPELITFEDAKIAEEMKNANLEKIVAVDEFKNLNEESKKIFFKNIKLNKEELDTNYFENENANYLVITGTKPFYGDMSQKEFEAIITQVYNEYKDIYTILYKPHPSALPDEKEEKFLSDLNIKVLPGTIPMEAISFIYPNLKLGGFASSLYMSADEGKTEFFFAESKEDLVAPLNQLYDNLFSDAEFYY